MQYTIQQSYEQAALYVAHLMCAAACTAPKTKGQDFISTAVITKNDISELADEMERLSESLHYGFFCRDAKNVRNSQAVVLVGVQNQVRGLQDGCGYCGFDNCNECLEKGGVCAYGPLDLGIAVGAAVSVAADHRVDNRVMFSAGRAALSKGLLGADIKQVLAIPLSISGKSPFFDRK